MFHVFNVFSLTVSFVEKLVKELHATSCEFSLKNQYRVHSLVQAIDVFKLTFCSWWHDYY